MIRPPRRPIAFAASCAALAVGGGAQAATYSVLRATGEAVTVLDPASAEKVGDGHTRRVQVVRVQKSIAADGPPQPGYVATLTDYDCAQWRYRWRGFSAFSRTGQRLLHKDNEDPAWSPIGADPEASAAARIVCDGQAAGQVYAASSLGQLVSTLMSAWDAADPPLAAPPPSTRMPPPHKKARR